MNEYIDKKQAIDRIASCYCMDCEHSNGILCSACEHQDDMDLIDDMPAVDVQPVKHGRWKKDTMGYDVYIECSECGTSFSMSNYIEEEWRELMRYCPCCGARMDLKDGDT